MASNITNCPICGLDGVKKFPYNKTDLEFIRCRRCGEFEISWEFVQDFSDIKKRTGEIGYILSGLARELFETGEKVPIFLYKNIDETLKHYLIPDVNRIDKKVKKLLQRFREKTEYFGEELRFNDLEIVSLAYAQNVQELKSLFELINLKKLANIKIDNDSIDGKNVEVKLLADGWDFTNSLEKKNKDSEQGFVAVWFDELMNESINAIEAAILSCNFKPICIRDDHFSEKIMDKALGEIRKSRFVVVDLTGNRGSVFFEAGFAFGLGIETIYVYKEDSDKEKLPLEFYVRHYQCYKYKNATDLKEKLKNAINARIKI